MFKRFKEWLIKKPGGYTKREYEIIADMPVARLSMEQYTTHTLKAERAIEYEYFDDGTTKRQLKDALLLDLLKVVEPFIEIETSSLPYMDTIFVRAVLRVLQKER